MFHGIGANTNPLYRNDAMYVTSSILHREPAVTGFLLCESTMQILNKHNEENLDKYRHVAGKDSEKKLGKEKTHIEQEQRDWKRLFHKNSHLESWVYGHNPYLYLWKSFWRCSSSLVRAFWTF